MRNAFYGRARFKEIMFRSGFLPPELSAVDSALGHSWLYIFATNSLILLLARTTRSKKTARSNCDFLSDCIHRIGHFEI